MGPFYYVIICLLIALAVGIGLYAWYAYFGGNRLVEKWTGKAQADYGAVES